MYTVNKIIKDEKLINSIESYLELFNKSRINTVFFDIETTGLSPKNSILYLIGYVIFSDGHWEVNQLFSDSYEDEMALILTFNKVIQRASVLNLVQYNGDSFDINYIKKRARILNLNIDDEFLVEGKYQSTDLLKLTRKVKNIIKTDNLKQKTIENYLGLNREDPYTGRELIKLYKEYIAFHEEEKREAILCHNYDDLLGLIYILPITNYLKLKEIDSLILDDYDYEFSKAPNELIFKLSLNFSLVKALDFSNEFFGLSINDNKLILNIKIIEANLKHFYDNYKDYYFIPSENKAIHKSVATFIDKEYRVKAKKENCYASQEAKFIIFPNKEAKLEPSPSLFKREYEDDFDFIRLDDLEKIKEIAYLRSCLKYAISCVL